MVKTFFYHHHFLFNGLINKGDFNEVPCAFEWHVIGHDENGGNEGEYDVETQEITEGDEC